MENVISIANTLNVSRTVREANEVVDLYFPVTSKPIQAVMGYGDTVPGGEDYQAIVREDTGQILAVHKSDYHLVPNEDIYPQYEDALKHSNLDLNGMSVTDQISFDGGRSIRTYQFPEHRVRIGDQHGQSDYVDLQMHVINSYDGSYAFKSMVGAYRILCMNGMVIGEKFAQTYGKHTKNLDIASSIKKVNSAVEIFLANADMWKHWGATNITDAEALGIIQQLPGINERLAETLMTQWQIEHMKLGRTKWSLFNALTYWSTHATVRQTSEANASSVVLNREARVRKVLGQFDRIAA